MAYAVVWDAYLKNKYEGPLFRRYSNGIAIDLANGLRYFATNNRIISVEGEEVFETEGGSSGE